jgi:predicted GIY-YIG superfamily endonuclease
MYLFTRIGNRFSLRTIFKTKHTLRGTLMKTGSVTDAQKTKQCVYSIPCDCGKCYIGETNRPIEVRIKEHKCNLTQGLLEKSKLAQHAYEEGHKICSNKGRVLQIEPIKEKGPEIGTRSIDWTQLSRFHLKK